jgi:hypothetical protein
MWKIVFLTFIALVTLSCIKKEGCTNPYAFNYDSEAQEDDCSCIAYVDNMEGTYKITVTHYPRQTLQEGDQFEALVFRDHANCNANSPEDFNFIKFNNVFANFECGRYPLDKYTFNVSLDDNDSWAGAPIDGIGTIKNGVFHFEGSIYTSDGQYPIILDGTKISSDRRTDSC